MTRFDGLRTFPDGSVFKEITPGRLWRTVLAMFTCGTCNTTSCGPEGGGAGPELFRGVRAIAEFTVGAVSPH